MSDITILSRRELGFNPTQLTVDQFVDMIMEDIEVAKKTHFEITSQKAEERYEKDKKNYFDRRDKAMDKIIEVSFLKYKREYYRQQFVKKEIAKWPEEYEKSDEYSGQRLTYVDWSMKPWDMGTTSCSLTRNNEDKVRDFFKRAFENDFNNKYFSQCTGWEIALRQRPYVKLILSEKLEAEWKADEKRLADAIYSFYEGTNYWGD